ncbi:hypothetical protein KIPB_002251 [Kipferlia bialata]|uniref:Uncharacterized protein n=1 Tax=Kipferlia bialata TaxID=797122 RepID=A0A9K3CQA6_9EUKA|nr:hypothetical protein KIPB_002251 [Kipferlia bialata]|eukprot:g2251.t1
MKLQSAETQIRELKDTLRRTGGADSPGMSRDRDRPSDRHTHQNHNAESGGVGFNYGGSGSGVRDRDRDSRGRGGDRERDSGRYAPPEPVRRGGPRGNHDMSFNYGGADERDRGNDREREREREKQRERERLEDLQRERERELQRRKEREEEENARERERRREVDREKARERDLEKERERERVTSQSYRRDTPRSPTPPRDRERERQASPPRAEPATGDAGEPGVDRPMSFEEFMEARKAAMMKHAPPKPQPVSRTAQSERQAALDAQIEAINAKMAGMGGMGGPGPAEAAPPSYQAPAAASAVAEPLDPYEQARQDRNAQLERMRQAKENEEKARMEAAQARRKPAPFAVGASDPNDYRPPSTRTTRSAQAEALARVSAADAEWEQERQHVPGSRGNAGRESKGGLGIIGDQSPSGAGASRLGSGPRAQMVARLESDLASANRGILQYNDELRRLEEAPVRRRQDILKRRFTQKKLEESQQQVDQLKKKLRDLGELDR